MLAGIFVFIFEFLGNIFKVLFGVLGTVMSIFRDAFGRR
jgi:hypothetical protein